MLTFEVQSLLPVTIIIFVACIIPIILSVLKLKIIPSLVLEILAGLILALIPFTRELFTVNNSGHISLTSFNEGLYVVGMSVLLFLSGLDTDFSVFSKNEAKQRINKKIIKFVLINFLIVVGLSFGFSFVFKDYIKSHFVIGIILLMTFFSSTFASLVIPVIHNYDLQNTILGKIIASYATLAELVSIIFLSISMLVLGINKDVHPLVAILIFLGFVVIIVVRKYIPLDKVFGKFSEGIVHLSTRVIFLILLVSIILFDLVGVEYILGAFLSGMLLRGLKLSHQEFERLEAIGYGLFVPIFYVLVGFKVGLMMIESGSGFFTLNTFFLFLVVLIILMVVRTPLFYLLKHYKLSTTIATILITTSTIIVAITIEHLSVHAGIFDPNLTNILIFASLVTCVIPPILFANNDNFSKLKKIKTDEVINYENEKEA